MDPRLLPLVKKDEPVTAAHMNSLRAALIHTYQRSTARSGPYTHSRQNGAGFLIESKGGGTGAGGTSCKHWRFALSTDPDSQESTITFRDGLISNIAATNRGQGISVDLEQERFIVASVNASDGSVSDFTIELVSSATSLSLLETVDVPPPSFKVNLGIIANGTVTMFVCKNLMAVPVETRKESNSASYGEEPFDRYYKWSVTEEGNA